MYTSTFLCVISLFGALITAAPVDEAWLQPRDSSVASLFKRGEADPSNPNFASAYPDPGTTPPTSSLPQAWLDKLKTVNLPSVGPSNPNNGYPTYPEGESGADEHICSFTYQCTTAEDLVNPPAGVFALSFDDGPSNGSPALYDFLAKNQISSAATHFMIGGNIVGNPTGMQAAANAGGHIAVHTWSHPYMTTLSNEDVLGELGWTMQIISDLNGGRIPKYWRPPFGDVDNRVRAIAKGVFGLETVPWNTDSADWAIGSNPQYTRESVESMVGDWLQNGLDGNKSNGLLLLEHELNDNTVGVFEDIYPKIGANGWKLQNVADAFNMDWYVNSGKGNSAAITTMSVAANTLVAVNSTASQASTTSAASASASVTSSNSTSASLTSAKSEAASASAAASASQSSSAAVNAAAASGGAKSSATSLIILPASGSIFAVVGVIAAFL